MRSIHARGTLEKNRRLILSENVAKCATDFSQRDICAYALLDRGDQVLRPLGRPGQMGKSSVYLPLVAPLPKPSEFGQLLLLHLRADDQALQGTGVRGGAPNRSSNRSKLRSMFTGPLMISAYAIIRRAMYGTRQNRMIAVLYPIITR